MRSPRVLATAGLLLLAAGSVTADTYDLKSFKERLKPLVKDAEIIALCSEFMTQAQDFDVVRRAQDAWKSADPVDALYYAQEQANDNPTSARFAYLYGRLVEDKVEAVRLGRNAVEFDPDWPYGYRLVAAQYVYYLFQKRGTDEEQAQLAIEWDHDRHLIWDLAEMEPQEAYAQDFLRWAQRYEGDFAGLERTLEKGRGLGARWADGFAFAEAYAGQGRFDDARRSVTDEVDYRIREQGWPAEKRDRYVEEYYLSALSDAGAYDEVIRLLGTVDPAQMIGDDYYNLACVYALKGEPDNAFAALFAAGQHDWDNTWQAHRDSDLKSLHSDPRWTEAMAVFQKNWDAGKPERRIQALAKKIEKDAPWWSLPDADGNVVELVDMHGKVVVLDFWATWCGPCELSMPLIDEFVREYAGEDVVVFSVDVWEKGRKGPLKYMRDNNYAMRLLYGTDELAEAYEVEGIPHICVIDRNGRIRYRESGVSESLLENLIFWTEDLLAEL